MSFKRFDQQDVVVSAESISTPVWSGNQTTLNTFFTSSTQVGGASGDYYYNIYQTGSTLDSARVQFSLAYGNKNGLGTLYYNANVPGKTPSSTIYGQYRSLIQGDEDADFIFGGVSSEHFYAVAVDRARYKEKLLPGTLDLVLTNSGSDGGIYSRRLTDNSQVTSTVTFTDAGRVYELVSGSLGTVHSSFQSNGYTLKSGSYGKVYPDIGVVLLNATALEQPYISGGLDLRITTAQNTVTFSGSTTNLSEGYDLFARGGHFRIQSEETVASNFVFVRARNNEFNYSSNPSLITGSGEIRHNVMINSPQSYVTTVGLYNDNNDLLAVAKLSRPLLKDFTKESLIRVKLDY
jgi:hypothetical protein